MADSRRPVRVLAHGSLMSATGLGRHASAVREASVVRVRGSRRVFAKPPRGRFFLAMDATLPGDRATLRGDAVAPGSDPDCLDGASAGFEGLLLTVDGDVATAFAKREGYPLACWAQLESRAGGSSRIAEWLRELAASVGDRTVAYRAALHEAAGFTEEPVWHYLPHPVDIDGAEPAVIYVSPAVGRTGDPLRDSVKTRLPKGLRVGGLDTLDDVGQAAFAGDFQRDRQIDYAKRVILAAAHGVHLADLTGPGASLAHLLPTRDELLADRVGLAHALAIDFDAALARSGIF